jgi:hypothetical protein
MGNDVKSEIWSSPLLDYNFAYRIGFEASKAVLTPTPPENPNFYSKGKELEERIKDFPKSYIDDHWNYTTLQHVADISKMVEAARYRVSRNFPIEYSNNIFIFPFDYLRIEEITVPVKIKKIVKGKTTRGIFRKKEVEKSKVIEETEEKNVYRVHLEEPVIWRERGDVHYYVDCNSKLSARYTLDKLKWIANNPYCEERVRVRIWLPGDAGGGSGDHGQREVFIRWGDFVNMKIPVVERLEEMYRKFDADHADLMKLKNSVSTWF